MTGSQHPGFRRWQAVRRATLLFLLCFTVLQYYFLSIGVDILSLQGPTVFISPLISPTRPGLG